MSGKVAILIDGGYLSKVCPKGTKIDFSKLVEKLRDGQPLHRAYYYNCLPYQPQNPTKEDRERTSKTMKFYEYLNRIERFCVRQGKLKFRGLTVNKVPIFEQKRVDLMLGLDVASLIRTQPRVVDTIVVVTGDGDMLPALIAAREAEVIVKLVHGNSGTYDQEIWENADERLELSISFFDSIKL